MRKYQKKKTGTGRASITCIVLFLLVVMSIQIVKLYHKDQQYTARETELEQQLTQERAMEQVSERAGFYLQARAKSNFRPEADGKLQTEVMIFSNVYGLLGQTKGAAELLRKSGFTEKFI